MLNKSAIKTSTLTRSVKGLPYTEYGRTMSELPHASEVAGKWHICMMIERVCSITLLIQNSAPAAHPPIYYTHASNDKIGSIQIESGTGEGAARSAAPFYLPEGLEYHPGFSPYPPGHGVNCDCSVGCGGRVSELAEYCSSLYEGPPDKSGAAHSGSNKVNFSTEV